MFHLLCAQPCEPTRRLLVETLYDQSEKETFRPNPMSTNTVPRYNPLLVQLQILMGCNFGQTPSHYNGICDRQDKNRR
jgi:hypothetical protein